MSKIGFLDPQLFNFMGSMSPDVENVIVSMIMIFNTSSLPKLVVALRVPFFCFEHFTQKLFKTNEITNK